MGFGLSELVIVVVFLFGAIFIIGLSSDSAKANLDNQSQEYQMVDGSVGLFSGLLKVNRFTILIFGVVFIFGALMSLSKGGKGGSYR
jgi:hypothetical protein